MPGISLAPAAALRPARFIFAIAAALILAYVLIWIRISPIDIGRSDFTSFYVGGTLLRDGHGAGLYNQVLQQSLHSRLIAPDREPNLPFVNPPPAALVVLPVTFLPLAVAFHIWSLLELAMLALAVVLVTREAPWPSATPPLWKIAASTAALASMGTWTLLLQAQWTPVLALGLALAYRFWKRGHEASGALVLVLAAGMAKPQLALGLVAFLLGWRSRRIIIGAVAGAAALGLGSLALVGPSGIRGLITILAASTTRWDLGNMLSAIGVVGSYLGTSAAAHIVGVLLSAIACAAAALLGAMLRRDPNRLDSALVGATILSLLAAPHAYSDDLVMLAPMFVIAVAATARRADADLRLRADRHVLLVFGCWTLISVAAFADFADAAAFPPGQLTAWALLIAAVSAVVATARNTPQPTTAAKGGAVTLQGSRYRADSLAEVADTGPSLSEAIIATKRG
jgi:alpha-1,2-mannosyltransferase